MHERSLVLNLLKQVEQIRREQDADTVSVVRCDVGELAGVDISLLSSAFDELTSHGPLASARLAITPIPLAGHCQSCDREQPIVGFDFRCDHCGQGLDVIRGDQIELVSVSLTQNQSKGQTTS